MSQLDHQNTYQNGLFKSFQEIKPEANNEQSSSLFKSAPHINSHSDIMSTIFFTKVMYRPTVPFWM